MAMDDALSMDDTRQSVIPTLFPPNVPTVYGLPPTVYPPKGRFTLHLGVLDQPYRNSSKKARPVTTGDVAGFLEKRYAIMETFYKVHEESIAKTLESGLAGAFESLLMGHAVDPWGSATQSIQTAFRQFISSGEAERVGIPGTPTKAALRGVSHRLKRPYRNRNPRRPSFRDTGMFMNSFRSWISD